MQDSDHSRAGRIKLPESPCCTLCNQDNTVLGLCVCVCVVDRGYCSQQTEHDRVADSPTDRDGWKTFPPLQPTLTGSYSCVSLPPSAPLLSPHPLSLLHCSPIHLSLSSISLCPPSFPSSLHFPSSPLFPSSSPHFLSSLHFQIGRAPV